MNGDPDTKSRTETACEVINARIGWAGAHPEFIRHDTAHTRRSEQSYTGRVVLSERAALELQKILAK